MSEFTVVGGREKPDHAAPAPPSTDRDQAVGDQAEATVPALLCGGPAGGRLVEVPRIAGTYPLLIGVDGSNYVRDRDSTDRPSYGWWPPGAGGPTDDPDTRTEDR